MRACLAFTVALLLAGTALAGPAEDELMATDQAFSAMSAAKGSPAAFLAYVADDVRIFGGGGEPTIGKEKVAAEYASPEFQATRPNETSFTWEPVEAFASKDGTLGWTNGHWKIVGAPDDKGARRTSTGHYVTIWRKGPQGWKIVADIGTNDPPTKPK